MSSPGGIIVILDHDECFTDENKQPLRPAKDGVDADNSQRSWCTRFWTEVFERTDDGNFTDGEYVRSCFAADPKIDTNSIRHEIFYMPMGWDGGDPVEGAEIGKMSFINFWVRGALLEALDSKMTRLPKDIHRALKPAFLARGVAPEIIDDWVSKADQEISGTPKKFFSPIRGTWARRL
ncbi:hypothetical protein SISNIDRAFT_452877 [Sistotremastrum niveocremeum HHB9708]|uniref:Uncharacterized protein n=1 Tax=Sistotremastrum niveocremeum HHB9708 TaxID=1314777 RepID=A0A164W5Z8_9AGAM|nr:hypothetical protein SISNIDRAFT_452877 [Sistotremastrum niveocremeum HHB9708]